MSIDKIKITEKDIRKAIKSLKKKTSCNVFKFSFPHPDEGKIIHITGSFFYMTDVERIYTSIVNGEKKPEDYPPGMVKIIDVDKMMDEYKLWK